MISPSIRPGTLLSPRSCTPFHLNPRNSSFNLFPMDAHFFLRVAWRIPRSGFMRPKGSASKLEARRRLAASLLAKGQGIREVARSIGAAPSSVKRWKDALEEGGKNALKSKPHTGRPSRLSPKQRQHLLLILQRGPRAAKMKADQWTCRLIGRIIRQCFGVKYHPDHVSRILRGLGWRNKIQVSTGKKIRRTRQPRLRRARQTRRDL
jgi:transposase